MKFRRISLESHCFYTLQIALCLSQVRQNKNVPMLKIVIDSIGTQLQMRTIDMGVSLYLGGIYVQHLEYKGEKNNHNNRHNRSLSTTHL